MKTTLRYLFIVGISVAMMSTLRAEAFKKGTYFIVAAYQHKGFCIDIPTQHVHDYDGEVQKSDPTGGYTQKWDFIPDTDRPSRFLIKWHEDEKYLAPDGNSNDDGGTIKFNKRNNTAYQSWRIEDADNGLYYIINDGSGKAIDYWTDDAHQVKQKSKADIDQQKWDLQLIK